MRRLPQIAPRLGQWTGDGLTPNYFARISVLGFGFTALAASFTIVILPTRVLDFAPEESKNTYLGILSFVGLLIAVAVQPIAGGFSDRLRSRWGRRRPFIVGGTVASLPLLVAAGVAPTYVLLFLFICLLQLASNVAMGPYQALVRDLVPGRRRGAASGMKMLVEVVGAMTLTGLVALLVGRYSDGGNVLWVLASVLLLGAAMAIGAAVTTRSIAQPSPAGAELQQEEPGSEKVHRDYPWFLLSRFCVAIAAGSLQTFALFFLKDYVGLKNPAAVLGLLILVVGVTVLLTAYPAGLLTDRFGRKSVMVAATAMAGPVAIVLTAAQGLAAVIVVAVLAGAMLGAFLGAQWAMATDLVSVRRAAQQLGLLNLATAGGAGVAKLNGIWVDWLNTDEGTLGYSVLLIACGILFVVATLLVLKVRPSPELDPALARLPQGEMPQSP